MRARDWLRRRTTLMPLADALAALGGDGTMGRRQDVVPLTAVVGSASRAVDFDADFQLINPALRQRREGLSTMLRSGGQPAPLDLVQLGELYFVRDGHHRVSAAKALGWDSLPARVTRVCPVAYAMCCLRTAHLPSKAAERRFLERVPLPDDVRRDLWLDEPADWARLADSAEAWAYRTRSSRPEPLTARELAAAWWRDEVMPVLDRLRAGAAPGLRDVQLYVTALAVRDRLGALAWPEDLPELVATG
jgi:ParB-like nuclease domain